MPTNPSARSLYAQYLIEKTDDYIIETPWAFVTYRLLLDQKTVYIIDLYVVPEVRKQNVAAQLADEIAVKALEAGCTTMIGTVVPSNKNSTDSVKVLLAYGMTLKSSSQDLIIFEKPLIPRS